MEPFPTGKGSVFSGMPLSRLIILQTVFSGMPLSRLIIVLN
ncbi:MAG: hypothetical protein WCS37_15890 [Chloroflexota bacterium]